MAGSWPDCPSRKIAYHDDGTVVVGRYEDLGAPYENFYEWSVAGVNELNDLDHQTISPSWPNTYSASTRFGPIITVLTRVETAWIFPELRDIYGFVGELHHAGGSVNEIWLDVYTSPDTTNGIDGTWTHQFFYYTGSNVIVDGTPESWRTMIVPLSVPGTRSVRVRSNNGVTSKEFEWRAVYIFGTIASTETPDRILYVDDNTGPEFTKPMDWGDVPRGTTLDRDIYLLNNSATLAAGGVMVLDFTTLYNSSDTWYQIKSTAGGAFADTFNVPTMAAATRYPTGTDTFTVRLTVPDDEPLSIYEAILELSPATSWT